MSITYRDTTPAHPLWILSKSIPSLFLTQIVLRIAFVKDLDRTRAADTHALGSTAAQIAMVDIIIPLNKRMKGTRF